VVIAGGTTATGAKYNRSICETFDALVSKFLFAMIYLLLVCG